MRAFLSCLLLGAVGVTLVYGEDSVSALSGVQGPAREKRSHDEFYNTNDCPPGAIFPPSGPRLPSPPVVCAPGTHPVFSPAYYMDTPHPRLCMPWVDDEGACHVANEVYGEDECLERFGQELHDDWVGNTVRYRRSVPTEQDSDSQLGEEPHSRERRRSPTGNSLDIYTPGSYFPGSNPPGSPGSLPGNQQRQNNHAPGMQLRYRRRSPTGNSPDIYAPGSYFPGSNPPGSPGSLPGNRNRENHAPGLQLRYRRRSPVAPYPYQEISSLPSPAGADYVCIPSYE